MRRYTLGFIGAGNMAEAICRAVLTKAVFAPDEITAYDPADDRRDFFSKTFKLDLCADNTTVVDRSENVLLAVKPQQVGDVLDEIRAVIAVDQLLISIAAGISSGFLAKGLGKPVPVVRVMPNTPLLVGAGMTGLCKGEHATDDHLALAGRIFGSAGVTLVTDEKNMDAITALSGSGPAYFFYLVEAMAQAGVNLGLRREDVVKLSAQTCWGAGKMLLETQADPAELRRRVTSPGGTTEAAMGVLEAAAVKKTVIEAVEAAGRRSIELGR